MWVYLNLPEIFTPMAFRIEPLKYKLLAFTLIISLVILSAPLCIRLKNGFLMKSEGKQTALWYQIKTETGIKDITQAILTDPSTSENLKSHILAEHRRIIVFKYLSGSYPVAGYLNYVPDAQASAIFFRGGNGHLGIMKPSNLFSSIPKTNVIATLYRGNLYQSEEYDQLGGDDLKDIDNMLNFIPAIEKKLNLHIKNPEIMTGVSRGGMQAIAALAHSKNLKKMIKDVYLNSGNVDLRISQQDRFEMKFLFYKKYWQQSTFNSFDEWLEHRNPSQLVKKIPKGVNINLYYGLKDKHVSLSQQNSFINALNKAGINNKLNVFKNESHGVINYVDKINAEIAKKYAESPA